jgi:hypothetical protein
MAMSPQPPRPPVPTAPPRTGSHLVAIALLTLALIVLLAGLAVWTGLRFLSRSVQVQVEEGAGGKKEIAIRTPVGSLEAEEGKRRASLKTPVGSLDIQGEVNEARLGLPLYPGAKRVKKEGATINIDLPGEESVRVAAAAFETPDRLEKVKAFYKQRLGSDVTKFTERNHEGKTVFEIKRRGEEKVVALRSVGGGTRIELAHVTHGPEEAN